MNIIELRNHLRKYLPRLSDKFTDNFNVSSYVVSGTTATIQTTNAHGLEVDDYLNIRNVLVPNSIDAITSEQVGTNFIASATLNEEHNYTYGYINSTIQIVDASASIYNGTFNIVNCPSFTEVQYEIESLLTGSITGAKALENRENYNGVFKVLTVPNVNTVTIEVPSGLNFTAYISSEIYPVLSNNACFIETTLDQEKLAKDLTNMGRWGLFCTLGEATASKNKNISSDGVDRVEAGDTYLQEVSEQIVLFVFVPASSEINGIDAQNYCSTTLRKAIIKCLAGYQPEKEFESDYTFITYLGDGLSEYSGGAYYVHAYEFATTVNITCDDIFIPPSNAIRATNTQI